MAPPASKRRKLSHSSDNSQSDNDSFASFSDEEPLISNHDSNHAPSHSGHVELGGPDEEEEEEDHNGSDTGGEEMEVEDDSSDQEEASVHPSVTKAKVAPRKVGNTNGTTYNGEVFKSNLFKLQVDELLDQVRPVNSRKNDYIESALRTLKTIIEAIPARKPTSVRLAEHTV